jgi:hypothetical protein
VGDGVIPKFREGTMVEGLCPFTIVVYANLWMHKFMGYASSWTHKFMGYANLWVTQIHGIQIHGVLPHAYDVAPLGLGDVSQYYDV